MSIRDVTDAADVGFGTFYGLFETKEQLLEEAAVVALDGDDPDIALMAVGGALLGVMQMLDAHPELDAGAVADQFAVRILRMLGVAADEAAALCSTAAPAVPELP